MKAIDYIIIIFFTNSASSSDQRQSRHSLTHRNVPILMHWYKELHFPFQSQKFSTLTCFNEMNTCWNILKYKKIIVPWKSQIGPKFIKTPPQLLQHHLFSLWWPSIINDSKDSAELIRSVWISIHFGARVSRLYKLEFRFFFFLKKNVLF